MNGDETDYYGTDEASGGFGFLKGLLGSATNVYTAISEADAARKKANTAADLARAQQGSKTTTIVLIGAAVVVGLIVVVSLFRK